MNAISLQRQQSLMRPCIYGESMCTWMSKSLELLNINQTIERLAPAMLFFKCPQGHLTQCNTPKHRLVFCKECNLLHTKYSCDRYTDRIPVLKKFSKSKRIEYQGKSLYQYPESYKRNYRSEYWKRVLREKRLKKDEVRAS